ncbi:MAG: cisplatin damage response ATP-dependent DNA ligase [Stappiaceae bacterium]
MKSFANLLDRLSYEPRRNGKIALLGQYFSRAPDPDRGWALAALTGGLDLGKTKPSLIRALIEEKVDPYLFELSYDFVGDLSETVALIWPEGGGKAGVAPTLTEVVETLADSSRTAAGAHLERWLNRLDETGRWALLKLITGGMRVGVSARLAKTALASLGDVSTDDIEEVWYGQAAPYEPLFAWVEGRADRPERNDPAFFRPPMLAHPLVREDLEGLKPSDFLAEWKWDGIRVQASGGLLSNGQRITRLFSRSGDDISAAFPDLLEQFSDLDATIDGELLVVREGCIQPFGVLQKRLNRKTVSKKLIVSHPVMIRAYDLLCANGEDLRSMPFYERRRRLEEYIADSEMRGIDLSPIVNYSGWAHLSEIREDPGAFASDNETAVEGLMLKKRDGPYLPGRPKGHWYKWKRDPHNADAVLMYAQRGHGKRSSFYSDYTFGVWRTAADGGEELVPVGKAYFGFTDEELLVIDRYVRQNTINRFGPVREVRHDPEHGFVLEVAFEGLNRSTRHKSGIAMRFPRIARLRQEKKPHEADRLDVLIALLPKET